MNFKIIDDSKFIVKLNSSYLELKDENLYDDLKKILISIRKKYAYDIYGFYDVDLYNIKNLISILYFTKKDSDDFFCKTIDLKIIRHKNPPLLYFTDFILLKNYKTKYINDKIILEKELNKKDIYKLCEHYTIESINLQ